jgi:hypothetical protein
MLARIPAPRCAVFTDSDELFRRMLGAEMRVDLLVEQHRGDTALGVLGRYYDSGHGFAFLRLERWCQATGEERWRGTGGRGVAHILLQLIVLRNIVVSVSQVASGHRRGTAARPLGLSADEQAVRS